MKGLISQVLQACKLKGKNLKVAQRYLRLRKIKVTINVLKKRLR